MRPRDLQTSKKKEVGKKEFDSIFAFVCMLYDNSDICDPILTIFFLLLRVHLCSGPILI